MRVCVLFMRVRVCRSGKCQSNATTEQKDKLQATFDTDLEALEAVMASSSGGAAAAIAAAKVERGGTLDPNSVCYRCQELFDTGAHEKMLCTNCTKFVCAECHRNVQLSSYGEQRVRVIW